MAKEEISEEDLKRDIEAEVGIENVECDENIPSFQDIIKSKKIKLEFLSGTVTTLEKIKDQRVKIKSFKFLSTHYNKENVDGKFVKIQIELEGKILIINTSMKSIMEQFFKLNNCSYDFPDDNIPLPFYATFIKEGKTFSMV